MCYMQGCSVPHGPCSRFFVFYTKKDKEACLIGKEFSNKYASEGTWIFHSKTPLNFLVVPYADLDDINENLLRTFETDRKVLASLIEESKEESNEDKEKDKQAILRLYYGMDAEDHPDYMSLYDISSHYNVNNDYLASKALCKICQKIGCSKRKLAGWVRYRELPQTLPLSQEAVYALPIIGTETMICEHVWKHLEHSEICAKTCMKEEDASARKRPPDRASSNERGAAKKRRAG